MSGSFIKLYGSILDSSIWLEDGDTRLVWITMLAMADADGIVHASVGGLAHRARVDRAACEQALHTLAGPDPDSRDGTQGERIRTVQGGWLIINHRRYRDMRTPAQVRHAERMREYRASKRTVAPQPARDARVVHVHAEAEAYTDKERKRQRKSNKRATSATLKEKNSEGGEVGHSSDNGATSDIWGDSVRDSSPRWGEKVAVDQSGYEGGEVCAFETMSRHGDVMEVQRCVLSDGHGGGHRVGRHQGEEGLEADTVARMGPHASYAPVATPKPTGGTISDPVSETADMDPLSATMYGFLKAHTKASNLGLGTKEYAEGLLGALGSNAMNLEAHELVHAIRQALSDLPSGTNEHFARRMVRKYVEQVGRASPAPGMRDHKRKKHNVLDITKAAEREYAAPYHAPFEKREWED